MCMYILTENNNDCLLYLPYFFIKFLASHCVKEVLDDISTDNMKYFLLFVIHLL